MTKQLLPKPRLPKQRKLNNEQCSINHYFFYNDFLNHENTLPFYASRWHCWFVVSFLKVLLLESELMMLKIKVKISINVLLYFLVGGAELKWENGYCPKILIFLLSMLPLECPTTFFQ